MPNVCVCLYVFSYQMKWIGTAIYNKVFLFLSIAHCPVRKTTMSMCLYRAPHPHHSALYIGTVCAVRLIVCSLSTLQCNVSFTCQKRLLFVFVTWCDRSTNQMNLCASIGFTIAHTHMHCVYSMSDIPCPPWVTICESDVDKNTSHIHMQSPRLKMRATWFMVVTYLLSTIATKIKRLHFVCGIFHCEPIEKNCLQIYGFQKYFLWTFYCLEFRFLRT